MIILLDIDGVLVTTPGWKQVELLDDGFMKFSELAVLNLAALYKETNAAIVLTTTHRINYSESQWKEIFKLRGLNFETISKLNERTELSQLPDRATEIKEWVKNNPIDNNYVIIDDDLSLNSLDDSIKERWVATKPLIGFDKESKDKALQILKANLTLLQIDKNDFYPFMKVSLNGEYGVVTDQFWEAGETSTVNGLVHHNAPYKCYGLIRWDSSNRKDFEDWRGLWHSFVATGGRSISLDYKFTFINDDGTFKENQ